MLSSVARASRPCSPGPVPPPNQAEASFEVSDPKGMKRKQNPYFEGYSKTFVGRSSSFSPMAFLVVATATL